MAFDANKTFAIYVTNASGEYVKEDGSVSAADFYDRFGHSLYDVYGDVIRSYVASGHMKDEKGMVFLTRKGIDVSNRILVDFLHDENK